nr:hypothetical protein [uncultured Psychroserpens sp.]
MSKNNFKLIAIRPLEGCDKRFLKNLSKGTLYKFYNEYIFKDTDGNEVEDSLDEVASIIYNSKVPTDLYQINSNGNRIDVNISALVGKNGSGKSSLLELLYASCYVIASRKRILKDTHYYSEKRKKNNGKMSDEDIKNINEIQSVYNDLNVEFYYSINDNIFRIVIHPFSIAHSLISGNDENFSSGNYENDDENSEHLSYILNEVFFYTISINYSLYGLNSKFSGNWIRELFHKNDGYQTPLVINPYRDKGNINVNSELHLAQTRLLTNLINSPANKEINKKNIETVVLELNTGEKEDRNKEIFEKDIDILYSKFKEENSLSDEDFIISVYNKLYFDEKFGEFESIINERPNFEYQCKYVFRKTIKISQAYSEYNNLVEFVLVDKNNQKDWRVEFDVFFTFLSKLRDDRSHITFKLRQVLNNLRFNILHNDEENNDENVWIEDGEKFYYKIKIEKLINRLNAINKERLYLFEELVPVGCFIPVLWVKNSEVKKGSVSNLDVMSSGEQHFVHSIQSILYHLNNINSVFETKVEKIKYNYINIILDEIELYYHPEFQRIFVNELLSKIQSLAIPNIKGINILFCTHSPFILSDIPKENTLKLDNGIVKFDGNSHNTLGANIHDLLDNDFYLSNGFMGEYTKDKIFSLINFLDKEDSNDKRIINFNYKWDKNNSFNFIELVGEPILKSTLRELYFIKYSNEIDKEIERLNGLRNLDNR